jgi:pimeloyl-ACP methyl ester carboxylesterase
MWIYEKFQAWSDNKGDPAEEVPKGGHFAALEQPELFVAELRKSFAQVR